MSQAEERVDSDTAGGVNTICETISYYLNLRLNAIALGMDVVLPPAVEQIVELATSLPAPATASWAALATGKLPAKTKPKPQIENGEGKRARGKWTEAGKEEMIKLVDDPVFRRMILGDRGTHQGHVNWSALADRYKFSGTGPIQRQYKEITGRDPPGAKPRKEKEAEEEEKVVEPSPPPKKLKTEEPNPEEASADGWTATQSRELVKLVEDEEYRKDVTGKQHLKWSRIAEALAKGKKECKKKYEEVTGKKVET